LIGQALHLLGAASAQCFDQLQYDRVLQPRDPPQAHLRRTLLMKKSLLYVANRIWLILALYIASLALAAALFSLTEDKPFLDSLWWAAVTALTVGYGDITPVTPLGRTIGVLFGHFWIFMIIPMIIANILMHLVDDRNAFTHEEQIELMRRIDKLESLINGAQGPGAARAGTGPGP
jgi:hypothetical protein